MVRHLTSKHNSPSLVAFALIVVVSCVSVLLLSLRGPSRGGCSAFFSFE